MGDNRAFGVAEHGFAHGVEGAVGAGEGYGAGPKEVAETVGAVGDFPGGFDGGCVACCAKHDLGALVGGFAGLAEGGYFMRWEIVVGGGGTWDDGVVRSLNVPFRGIGRRGR